jgi:hypothetical protein
LVVSTNPPKGDCKLDDKENARIKNEMRAEKKKVLGKQNYNLIEEKHF